MKSLFSILFLFASLTAFAQESPPPVGAKTLIEGNDSAYIHPEKFPMFPGGMDGYQKFLTDNLIYPEFAQKNNIQGIVYLSMIVNETGEIEDVTILKDIGGGCGAEAKRVVESMPNWEPAEMNGKPVKVKTSVRVRFSIRDWNSGSSVASNPHLNQPPKFVGGQEGLSNYITKHLVVPDEVKLNEIEDFALVAFIVDKNGLVKHPRLVKGVENCKDCGRNAVELIKNMPAWSPAINHGRFEETEPELKIWFSYKSGSDPNNGSHEDESLSSWEVVVDSGGIYETVDKYPIFQGGQPEFDKYLVESIRYPEEARKKNIEGTVYLSVVINEYGGIQDVKVLKDIGGGCGAEAKRVVEAMPPWIPGVHEGSYVKVRIPLRIKFSLVSTPALPDEQVE